MQFRTSNGLEYCLGEFDEFCKNEGIVRHHTFRENTTTNGVIECIDKTLQEKTRSMLSNVGLSKYFWAKSIKMSCYLVNMSPSTILECKTPFEVWSNTFANYSS